MATPSDGSAMGAGMAQATDANPGMKRATAPRPDCRTPRPDQ